MSTLRGPAGSTARRAGTSTPTVDRLAPHERFDTVADATAALVLSSYSTSFGLACRLLAPPVRRRVVSVYALTRVADELVDAPRPDGSAAVRRALLGGLEDEVCRATRTGHSADLVVHAFARTARECDIEPHLVEAFFGSMRTDLEPVAHDLPSLATYIHGSAEAVGLMCLRAFLADEPRAHDDYARLADGARHLGAGLQKLNFLRDLLIDDRELGRRYLVGVEATSLSPEQRDRLIEEVRADLRVARPVAAQLPRSSRRAVAVCLALSSALTEKLARTPAQRITGGRVRLSGLEKVRPVVTALGPVAASRRRWS